jgi:hypothetical protein
VGPTRGVAHDGKRTASSAPGRKTRRSARLSVPRCGGKRQKRTPPPVAFAYRTPVRIALARFTGYREMLLFGQ